MPLFTTTRRVQFSETDMAGIVHFANFFRWMEETEHSYFRTLGFRIVNQEPDGRVIGWPRVSCSCSYSAPAKYDELIDCRLEVERVGHRSLTYQIEFWREGTKLASGRMKTACCLCHPDGSLTSIDIPDEFRAKIRESVPSNTSAT